MDKKSELIERVRAHLPAQLRELPVWLLHDDRKLPIYANGENRSGALDSPQDRQCLVRFETAAEALTRTPRACGLGVALGEVPGEEIRLSGVDFDHCYNGDTLDERVLDILMAATSYAEKSPSGKGVHVVGTGDIGTCKQDDRGFEIYSGARFFTVTGEHLNTAGLCDLTDAATRTRELFTQRETSPAKPNGHEGDAITQDRNTFLSREAFRLRKNGWSVEAILTTLRAMNAARCSPALPDEEVVGIAERKERIAPDGPGEWTPPAVVTYGTSFDAAKIPQRRWLLGQRRSVGEVTVDAGPPGVNKSTLLLSDAVQIVTGRPILADKVHERGEVLYLAGEDARRDVDARLAGILTYYHITPAELADKLHVVYLAEIDPVAYTLAEMVNDIATLNTTMLTWLRTYPDVLAVLIDPIAAWHRLIENSNEALQLLSSALRAIASQGGRHVGFDHHVTKVAQSDPEAHVGNLPALRGASAIAAATRWAFTLARLKPETATAHGVPDEDRKRYRRLDALKASYGADDGRARLLRVESVPIANGESVGVLVEVDTERTREEAATRKAAAGEVARGQLVAAFTRMLVEQRPRSAQAAAVWLIQHCPELVRGAKGATLSEFTVRRRLPEMIGPGLPTAHNRRPVRIVLRVRPGNGKGHEIDFAQTEVPL